MKLHILSVFLCVAITSSIASDEHRPKPKVKEDVRGKRNLEYSISHSYPIGSNFRLERRISSGPANFQLPARFSSFYSGPRPYSPKRGRPHPAPVPPYAVQMEPLVQYSQRDPLYDTSKLPLTADGHNELSKIDDLATDNNHVSENVYGQNIHGPPHQPIYYQKEPEPIIEIIIKESNVTLPPVPVPTPPPKKREQVQVFYVKYKKNPNGHGKDSVIYDKPIPALSPIIKEEEPAPPQIDQPQEYVTQPPSPSTTLRTIIRPDSETYIGTSGIHVTFGSEHKKHEQHSVEGHEESAPQPAVVFPQQGQFPQSGSPERRSPTQAFPPNFNPASSFNQQSFGQRLFPAQQTHFANNQYRPVNQQSVRSFHNTPPSSHQPRPQTQHLRSVPSQPFPPRSPPQPIHSQHRPTFGQPPHAAFPPNHQFPPPNQIPPNHHITPNHQIPPNHQILPNHQLSSNHQIPPNHQFSNHQPFAQQQHFPPPPHSVRPQFTSLLNQRPQTHFPTLQQPVTQNLQLQQQLNNKQPSNLQHSVHPRPTQQTIPLNFPQANQHLPQQPATQFLQQQPHIIPPGGELLRSVPRYEQHISVPDTSAPPTAKVQTPSPPSQAQNTQYNANTQALQLQLQQLQQQQLQQQQQFQQQQLQLQQQLSQQQLKQQKEQFAQSQQKTLSPQELRQQIQQQFRQFPSPNFAQVSSVQTKQQQQYPQQQQPTGQSSQQQNTQNYYLQNQQRTSQSIYSTNQNNPSIYQTTTQKVVYQSTTAKPETSTKKPAETKSDEKKTSGKLPAHIQLPDEVPDELREQLLSSGILSNADISVLDYDKVGDIPLDALPPEQLANFYGAGGGQQISASEQKISVVRPNGESVATNVDEMEEEASEIDEVKVPATSKQNVEMKVVHYDSVSEQGQAVQDSYVRDDATQVDPVVLNDNKYNRYLPLKVSGAQFPIPDVPELKGRNITSVVVLAPVDYQFHAHQTERNARDIEGDIRDVRFLAGEALKELLKEPTKENYEKWLQSENNTATEKQSVVLLVTGSSNGNEADKEIFMYDVATKTVSKLSGELSSAFVEAAENNANDKDLDQTNSTSQKAARRISYEEESQEETAGDDTEESPSNIYEIRVSAPSILRDVQGDLEAENSEIVEQVVDVSSKRQDLSTVSETLQRSLIVSSK